MKKYSSKLLEVFPEDVLKKSYEKTFLPDEIISFLDDDTCFFYFLQSHVNVKTSYAYFLIVNSSDNIFPYIKLEYIYKMLNVGRTSYHKIEKEFIERNLIKKEDRVITILNPDGLIDYFKDYIHFIKKP